MAVLINGQPGVSLGYQYGVRNPNSDTTYYFPTLKEALKIARAIPGASLKMREAYATEDFDVDMETL